MSKSNKQKPNKLLENNTPKIVSGTTIKILFCFIVMGVFIIMPPFTPLSDIGMNVLGVFIGTVLLLSLVDTTWPAILSIALFSITGVLSMENIIAASFGNWITMFVIMGFILTYALNQSGFTRRLTTFFLKVKLQDTVFGVLL